MTYLLRIHIMKITFVLEPLSTSVTVDANCWHTCKGNLKISTFTLNWGVFPLTLRVENDLKKNTKNDQKIWNELSLLNGSWSYIQKRSFFLTKQKFEFQPSFFLFPKPCWSKSQQDSTWHGSDLPSCKYTLLIASSDNRHHLFFHQ